MLATLMTEETLEPMLATLITEETLEPMLATLMTGETLGACAVSYTHLTLPTILRV